MKKIHLFLSITLITLLISCSNNQKTINEQTNNDIEKINIEIEKKEENNSIIMTSSPNGGGFTGDTNNTGLRQ